MALNHHVLAKTTTDAILHKFKTSEWYYNTNCGKDFYRVGTSADFPSPDAAFFDSTNKYLASFEFKPPTETKRGMLTGVGQSIAYLKSCNLSYLISPRIIDGFDMGEFLKDLYDSQIANKIPVGLILYDNDSPSNVALAHNVESLSAETVHHAPSADRYWAKHIDLPIALFHLLLHYYYLKKVGQIDGDAFKACWKERMAPSDIVNTLSPKPVVDVAGNVIGTLRTNKPLTFLEKKVPSLIKKYSGDITSIAKELSHLIDTEFVGDNLYNSYRKNYVTFLKHIQVIDSEGNITESGFNLYHIGLMNGPTSKVFVDYFTKTLLTVGHHLDLLLDIDSLKKLYPAKSFDGILLLMEAEYEVKGFIKRNPNRIAGQKSNTEFLKYERIIWRAVGLLDKKNNIQWRRITEICSLPEI